MWNCNGPADQLVIVSATSVIKCDCPVYGEYHKNTYPEPCHINLLSVENGKSEGVLPSYNFL